MQLENMMEMYQPIQTQRTQNKQTTYFVVGDLEGLSAVGLYSGNEPILKPWGMIAALRVNGLPIHDTYNIDTDGNVSNGHSTVNLKNEGKVYMPHGLLARPSIKGSSGY